MTLQSGRTARKLSHEEEKDEKEKKRRQSMRRRRRRREEGGEDGRERKETERPGELGWSREGACLCKA
jgi:hypothetical protein